MLVVLPNWVGDLVLATPALRALRGQFPDTHIAFLVKSHLVEILHGCDWMDEVILWPRGTGRSKPKKRQGFLGLAAQLRERGFDCAVLLTNSFRSALLTRLSGIPRRVGYDREGRGLLLTDRLLAAKTQGKYLPVPMIRYYNAIARFMGCRDCSEKLELFTTAEEEAEVQEVLTNNGVNSDQPIVVLNPGASFGPAKCWLPERFAEIGDHLAKEYNAAVFVSCGPKEVRIAENVANCMRQWVVVLSNPVMKLGSSKALIRRASLLVTNDTGPRHFANAFGTPVITIFGPTDPQWTLTPSQSERSLRVDVDCGPCMKRVCPDDHRCMTEVTSAMVLAEARALLNEKVSSASAKQALS